MSGDVPPERPGKIKSLHTASDGNWAEAVRRAAIIRAPVLTAMGVIGFILRLREFLSHFKGNFIASYGVPPT